MNEKGPNIQQAEELAQLPSLSTVEKMPEITLDEVRLKEEALNTLVTRLSNRLPMIHEESQGSESDPIETATETAGDAQEQSFVEAHLVRARSEMMRLNEKAVALREKTS